MLTIQCKIGHKLWVTKPTFTSATQYPHKAPCPPRRDGFVHTSSPVPEDQLSLDPKTSRLQCFGPFLRADYALAHKILSESAAVIPFCNPNPKVNIGCNRILVTFLGITPFRMGMWSTSRRPGAAVIHTHLVNGYPTPVIPTNGKVPLVAWSPTTPRTIRSNTYIPQQHHEKNYGFLNSIISRKDLSLEIVDNYEASLRRAVGMIVNGAKNVDPEMFKRPDLERAG